MMRQLNLNEMEMVSGGVTGGAGSGLLHVNGGPGISLLLPDGSDNPDMSYYNSGYGQLEYLDLIHQYSDSSTTIGEFTIELGESEVDLGENLDATIETDIEVEVVLSPENEGHVGVCLETIFGCIPIGKWPSD